ncbi:ABC transporter substrate-binding protein [Desulfobaculum sp.]
MPMKNARDRSPYSPAARYAALFLMLLFLVTALGCGKKSLPTTPEPMPGTPRALPLDQRAENAWKAKDYSESEMLYARLLERGGLAAADERLALMRLGQSAVKNGHAHIALDALDTLATTDPTVRDAWDWHIIFADAMDLLGKRAEVRRHLTGLLHDDSRPWELRFKAGITLARLQWVDQELDNAMRTLDGIYANSPEPAELSHGQLERALAVELRDERADILDALVDIIPPSRQNDFPYTIIRLEKARRLALNEDTWSSAWHSLSRLSREGNFADKGLVSSILAPLLEQRDVPEEAGGIALALPLSGPYGEIGWKILRGAGVAQWRILMQGGHMNIRVINTAAHGWQQKLAALPDTIRVVGGPLRISTFKTIHANGLTDERPYFAFLPSLGSAREGRDAWRFFSSPQDQVSTLLDLAVDAYGITDLAALHPDEPFGTRLTEIFRAEAEARLASVNATESYPPSAPTKWGAPVRRLVNTPKLDENGEEQQKSVLANGDPLPPNPPFKALFMPDGWAQAEQLVPQLFFYDEDRLLLMGPSLWAQGIARDNDIEARYFRLAVFPGAWWDDNPSPAAQQLRTALEQDGLGAPDFWIALGYDFVHFAQALGPVKSTWSSRVNSAVHDAQSITWSMAPIQWDDAGKAHQQMFLFQPTSSGFVPVDKDRLKARLDRVRAQHAERVQMLKDKSELEELKKLLKNGNTSGTLDQRVRTLLEKLNRRADETGADAQQDSLQ